ncbi:MAG: TIGR00730 family Rossman fold protein [Chitinophagaceae bacterium]
MFNSVAVFCGSKIGNDPLYAQHAKEVGILIAQQNITLIYGGGMGGLMGIVANAVLENKGKVIGVIPEMLNSRELQHEGLTILHVVADMHVRKKMMYDLCDAAIILPGGTGTLDEMFEIVTWNNLTIHDKKIILLNSAGYYNLLIGHINQMQTQGFLYDDWRKTLMIYETPDAIFAGWDADKNQNLRG